MDSFIKEHAAVSRAALIVAIFIFGLIEGQVAKRRDYACITWTWSLLILTIWTAYPLTGPRIAAGSVVFLCGVTLMIIYYRRRPPRS